MKMIKFKLHFFVNFPICYLLVLHQTFDLSHSATQINSANTVALPQNPIDLSFHMTKEAYYEDDWQGCVEHGMSASKGFKDYISKIVECRKSCRDSYENESSSLDQTLTFYGQSLKQITCIGRCKPQFLMYFKNLLAREAYDYIQICYYKLEDYSRGAAAAATFILANLNHDYMRKNMNNYREHLGVKEDEFIDLEAPEFERLYKLAVDSYEKKQWVEQLQYATDALDNYHDAYNSCSLLCEDGYETHQDANHELAGAIADQMERVVKCKSGCRAKLSKLDLKIVDDILQNLYHHLQYAHSQVEDYQKGAEYASAFLLHEPHNTSMITNKNYLKEVRNVPDEWFKVPEREARHKQRLDELSAVMNYLETEYISQHSEGKQKGQQATELREFLGGNIKINATAADLGGTERFVADGFATPEQCSQLVNMCQVELYPTD